MTVVKTYTRRRKAQKSCANRRVPEYITNELIQKVNKLPDCLATMYLKDQWLSKFVSKDTDPPLTRRTRAINKWLATERENEATNVRLLTTHGDYNILPRVRYTSFVTKLREVIASILGETVPNDALYGGFSGGASTSRSRGIASLPASKYLGQADITSAAKDVFDELIEDIPLWRALFDQQLVVLNVVEGNELFTVPKNTTHDRCCAKEPDLNMYLQKGLGDAISNALKRVGIDLSDQSRNRALARRGSITGDLATIDLASASDSMSYNLVELALPDLWFSALNALRSPVTSVDGDVHVNEMFSSMGNGFTFELETLLFYSIARTVAYFRGISGIISVYGDDIVCPVDLAEDLVWVLDYFGFQCNTDKSFWSGSFRESCGGHYFDGVDVTPFYLRTPITYLTDLIHTANAIRRWAERQNIGVLDPTVFPIWDWLASFVPKNLRGGFDTALRTQLVSPSISDSVLKEGKKFRAVKPVGPGITKNAKPRNRVERSWDFQVGAYMQWLNSCQERAVLKEGIETSSYNPSNAFYRVRPAPNKGQLVQIVKFPEELLGVGRADDTRTSRWTK